MALVNPNIALGFRMPEFTPRNAMAEYAQIQQIQGGQQAQALNALKMQEAQVAVQERNALNQAYEAAYNPQTGEIDANALRKSLSTGGFGSKLPALEKSLSEIAQQKLTRQKLQGEVAAQPTALAAANVKLLNDKLSQQRQFLDTLDPTDPNAPARYIQWHEANHADPDIGAALRARGITVDQSRGQIERAIAAGPQAFANMINQSKLGTEKFIEMNKPVTTVIDQSGQRQVLQTPGLGGTPVSVGTFPDVPLPAAVVAQKAQIAQAGRAPRPEPAPRTQQVTMSDGTIGIMNMDTGAVTPASLGGAPVKGKPSAFAEKTAAQRVQMNKDLGFAISQLTEVTKDGGLIDQSTGSGAGRLYDLGAGFVGNAPPGAIAIGKLKPIADLALKMIPRFEGPQSNKDTTSYQEAAGQLADPTLPTAIRKAAGKTVLRLMQERKNQFVTSDMAAEGTGAAPAAGVDASNPLLK